MSRVKPKVDSEFLHQHKTTWLLFRVSTKDRSGASSKSREKKEHLEEPSDAPLKDADPELRHSN